MVLGQFIVYYKDLKHPFKDRSAAPVGLQSTYKIETKTEDKSVERDFGGLQSTYKDLKQYLYRRKTIDVASLQSTYKDLKYTSVPCSLGICPVFGLQSTYKDLKQGFGLSFVSFDINVYSLP